ncbi:hypothetical protein [Flavitalea sp.]|nr:hypothetical protein [Flavitalea sp.]
MKKHYFELKDGLSALDYSEMQEINGGASFWEWAGWVAGQTVRCFEEFTKTAAEYQSSLPANLKK